MKVKSYISSLILVTVLFGFCACKKSSPVNTQANGQANTQADNVYIVGVRTHMVPNVADENDVVYWKNGRIFKVNSGTATDAYPTGIDVADTAHIYVIGYLGAFQTLRTPVYWINNNVWQLIENSQGGLSVGGVAVSVNKDIYIAGFQSISPGAIGSRVFYWKNWNEVQLAVPGNVLAAYAYGITISGSDVYVYGSVILKGANNRSVAAYWKNGQLVMLTDGTSYSTTTGVAISGNDVYIAGYTITAAGAALNGYWKNGQFVTLIDAGKAGGIISGICVTGNDVYVCGAIPNQSGYSAGYWKNGQFIALPNSGNSIATAIALSKNSDVYVIGTSTGFNSPCYWKNGQYVALKPLDDGIATGNYNLTAIVVQ